MYGTPIGRSPEAATRDCPVKAFPARTAPAPGEAVALGALFQSGRRMTKLPPLHKRRRRLSAAVAQTPSETSPVESACNLAGCSCVIGGGPQGNIA